MQIGGLDSQKLYLLFILAVVGIVIAIPLINLLAKFRSTYSMRRAQQRAMGQRKNGGQKQVFVRQTDIESNMTREDRQIHNEAEALLSKGNVVEASRLFESIKFQRKAIDVLENNGYIDEACNMLVRMKVPMRAAVIYERNDMLDKAAHFYNVANKPDKAAEVYLKLAKTNFRYIFQASEACAKAGDLDGQIKSEMMGMQTENVVQRCLENQKYDELVNFLRDPIIARNVLAKMDEDDRKVLLDNVPLVPQSIQMLAGWLWIYPDYKFSTTLLALVAKEVELAEYWWMIVPTKLREFLIQLINRQARFLSHRILETHAQAMRAVELVSEAEAIESIIQGKGPAPASLTETEPPKSISFPVSKKAG